MKPLMLVGLILAILGALMLAYQGVTYFTTEKVVDVGPVEVTAQKENYLPLPPILGGVALGVGVLLLVVGATRRQPAD
jgi:hypothetical protein